MNTDLNVKEKTIMLLKENKNIFRSQSRERPFSLMFKVSKIHKLKQKAWVISEKTVEMTAIKLNS